MNLQKYYIFLKEAFLKILILSLLIMQIGCRQFRDKGKDDAVAGCEAASCHPTSPIGHYPPVSGRHSVHRSYLEKIGNDEPCLVCHADYINNNQHKDGVLDKDLETKIVFFDTERSTTNWENSTNDCSNIVCHGDSNANWETGSGGCTLCHNEESIIDPGGTGVNGKHSSHVTDRGISCETCHYGYKEQSSHMNGVFAKDETVNFVIFNTDGFFNGESVSATYNPTDKSCEAISCHGGTGNVSWNRDLNGCTDCHAPGSSIDVFASGVDGKHTAHVADQGIECDSCHSGYYDQNTHLDGTLDNSGNGVIFNSTLNPSGGYDSVTKVCSNLYCHGNFTGGNTSNTADWDDGTGGACGDCHVTTPATGAHTKHIGGGANYSFSCDQCHNDGSVTTEHHYSGNMPVNGTVNIVFDSQADQGPGTVATYSGANDKQCNYTYCHGDFTGGITSNIADWDMGTGVSGNGGQCGECHANAPSNSADSGSHDKHTNAASYNYNCSLCHSGIASGTEGGGVSLTDISNHANFTKNVVFGGIADQYTGTSASYTVGTKTCNLTYCHGAFGNGATQWLEGNDGNGGKALNAPTWTTGSSADCGSCHGEGANQALGVPTTGNVWESSGESHAKHAGYNAESGYNYPCGFCHNGVYDATLSIGDGSDGAYETGTKTPTYTAHADGVRTTLSFYTSFVAAGSTPAYTVAGLQAGNCDNIYCHSDGWNPDSISFDEDITNDPYADPGITTPVWGGASKSTITCTSCHNGSDGASGGTSSNLAPDEVLGNTGGGSGPWYGTHHDPLTPIPPGHQRACSHCHNSTTNFVIDGESDTDNSMVYTANRHVNRYKNVKFDASEITITDDYVRNATGGQCAITCHTVVHDYADYKWYFNTNNNFEGSLIYE